MVGVTFATSNFQSVNAFFIMLFAPVFSVIWIGLARKGWEPSAPVKFAFGLLLLGAGLAGIGIWRRKSTKV